MLILNSLTYLQSENVNTHQHYTSGEMQMKEGKTQYILQYIFQLK